MIARLQELDESLFLILNTLTSDISNHFWVLVTKPLFWAPLFVLFFVLFFVSFKRKTAVLYSAGIITSFWGVYAITYIVKTIVERPRPLLNEKLIEHMNVLYEPTGFSFFSGHASTSTAAAIFFYFVFRAQTKWAKLVFLFPLIFATSRIFVGVHYPSDILVGGTVGLIFGSICYTVFQKLNEKYTEDKLTS
ncbi:MAG: phosphatase PAP2 family protein [Psychroflexus halocasei]